MIIAVFESPEKERERLAKDGIARLEDLYDQFPEGVKSWLTSSPNDSAWENRHEDPEAVLWNLIFGINLDEVFDEVPLRQREYLAKALERWEELVWEEHDG